MSKEIIGPSSSSSSPSSKAHHKSFPFSIHYHYAHAAQHHDKISVAEIIDKKMRIIKIEELSIDPKPFLVRCTDLMINRVEKQSQVLAANIDI